MKKDFELGITLITKQAHNYSNKMEFIPLVPYNSYEEWKEMLKILIVSYQAMVEEGVSRCKIRNWCCYYEGISDGAKQFWELHGRDLFLEFTKGYGKDWCITMNKMIIHSLDTAVRVFIQTVDMLGYRMSGSLDDKMEISSLLYKEVEKAIANPNEDPNNMTLFMERNFQDVWASNEMMEVVWLPIAKVQEMKLAFAMLGHPRLGRSAVCGALSCDVIKLILSETFC
jgi:hypothetical protein